MPRNSGSRRFLEGLSIGIGALAVITGVAAVASWALDAPRLQNALPWLAGMKANTGFCVALLGAALCLMQDGPIARRAGKISAALAGVIGIVTLVEYAVQWNAGIDQLFGADTRTAATAFPGRPSPATAFTLAVLAAGPLCADLRAHRYIVSAAAVAAALVSWLALNGYLFGVPPAHGLAPYSSMSLPSAAILFLLSVGLMAMEPQGWPARVVVSRDMGGMLSRGLLPAAVCAPPLLGWAIHVLQERGRVDLDFAWSLYAVSTSAGSVGLILMFARRMSVIDSERRAATELSRHDPLTGLLNRRAFDAALAQAFSVAKRYSRPLSLLMLDLDNFKSYNDSFGHPAGDELLHRLADLLGGHPRETDVVARIGGEEFAILVPETELAGAQALAERIRAEVESCSRFRRRMTISIGAASMRADMRDPAMLIEAGDAALYEAKRLGRNRVVAVAAGGCP
jgi:diguanylate cyclase (GGDEF)-like protein